MINDYLYDTKDSPTWNVTKLKDYIRKATATPVTADIFSVSGANVLTVVLTAQQYSALASHFYAIEGEPTVLHPGPYQVKYMWAAQYSALEGSILTLTQDQRARDVYTLTIEVKS